MKVKVYSTSKHPLPQYATKQSAGLDLSCLLYTSQSTPQSANMINKRPVLPCIPKK